MWPDGFDEPPVKRAITFVDGQNLYRCVKNTFNCSHPNYDVLKLSNAVCRQKGWVLSQARFYTGFPSATDDPRWHKFWSRKLLAISRQGVQTFSRHLRYRDEVVTLADGTTVTHHRGREKGIDVRIAIDLIQLAHAKNYDVAVVFSQDQDLSEVADEIRCISREQQRWIRMVSAFPSKQGDHNCRGINKTDWFRMDQSFYDACVDPHDYR